MLDGVAKISPCGVVVNLQDLDILMYVFAPENHSALLGEVFLSHLIY
ncbi:MAG: hypothetical protein GQ563_00075 [Desulfuromusa sp.]|nr:hypothetical protein [Desulfuromusa sp.]